MVFVLFKSSHYKETLIINQPMKIESTWEIIKEKTTYYLYRLKKRTGQLCLSAAINLLKQNVSYPASQVTASLFFNAREKESERSDLKARMDGDRKASGVCLANRNPYSFDSPVLPWRPGLSRCYPRVHRSNKKKRENSRL